MATRSQSTIEKGSDIVQDFLCSTCEDKNLGESADYYCESCVKFYCRKCIYMHGQLFTKHSPNGRGNMRKWPLAKKVEDFLLKCDVHKEENLAMFCKDHSQLCCRNCAILNHRQCKTVMLLSDLVKNTSTDLKQVSDTIQTTLAELKELQDHQEAGIRFVQCSFDEQLQKIQETREKIIAALNMLEMNTLKEMKDTLTKRQASLKSDVDKCATFRDELKQFGDAIKDIRDKGKHELSHIASIKCHDKIQLFEKYRKENFVQVKSSITFQPNSEIVQYLTKLSGLGRIEHIAQPLTVRGDPDQVIQMDGHSVYDFCVQGDSAKELFCSIEDICVLPSGEVLLADSSYKKVKLLNERYQLVSYCAVSGVPWGLCQITPNEVGVSFGSEVQFIKVNNSRLVTGRTIWFQHKCRGIANHHRDLYVTSGSALYKYTLSGELVNKLHEVKSDTFTIGCCAVSPTGDTLYITSYSDHKLLTLATDGSVLAIFTDPELKYPRGVDVTPAGQVLVCGSDTILQVDNKGSRKLATLATKPLPIYSYCCETPRPYSVCYDSNTASIIVGMWRISKILVYKVI